MRQTYLRNEGVKSLSYNAAGRSAIAGGDSVQALEEEMQASSRRHDSAGLVSIVVREATERPVKVCTCVAGAEAGECGQLPVCEHPCTCAALRAPRVPAAGHAPSQRRLNPSVSVVASACVEFVQERLVAMGGKLVTLKEQAGEAPNGTQFMITTGPAPELDATNLIIGKVRQKQGLIDKTGCF